MYDLRALGDWRSFNGFLSVRNNISVEHLVLSLKSNMIQH